MADKADKHLDELDRKELRDLVWQFEQVQRRIEHSLEFIKRRSQ